MAAETRATPAPSLPSPAARATPATTHPTLPPPHLFSSHLLLLLLPPALQDVSGLAVPCVVAACCCGVLVQIAELVAVQRAAAIVAGEAGGPSGRDPDSAAAMAAELQTGLTDLLISELVRGIARR